MNYSLYLSLFLIIILIIPSIITAQVDLIKPSPQQFTISQPTIITWHPQPEDEQPYSLIIHTILIDTLITMIKIDEFSAHYHIYEMDGSLRVVPSQQQAIIYQFGKARAQVRVGYVVMKGSQVEEEGELAFQAEQSSSQHPQQSSNKSTVSFLINPMLNSPHPWSIASLTRQSTLPLSPSHILLQLSHQVPLLKIQKSLYRATPTCLTLSPMNEELVNRFRCMTLTGSEISEGGYYLGKFEDYVAEGQGLLVSVDGEYELEIEVNAVDYSLQELRYPEQGEVSATFTRIRTGNSLKVTVTNLTPHLLFTYISYYCHRKPLLLAAHNQIELHILIHDYKQAISLHIQGKHHGLEFRVEQEQIEQDIAGGAAMPEGLMIRSNKIQLPKALIIAIIVAVIVLIGVFIAIVIARRVKKNKEERNEGQKSKNEEPRQFQPQMATQAKIRLQPSKGEPGHRSSTLQYSGANVQDFDDYKDQETVSDF